MNFLTLDDIDLSNKCVLIRADLNVPVKGRQVTDVTRIERLAPTLNDLFKVRAKVILISHFGRPTPNDNPENWDLAYSLKAIIPAIEQTLGRPVIFVERCVGKEAIEAAPQDSLILLENLRFYPGEEANDEDFSRSLSKLADVYINDAFSCSHRAHASVVGVTKYLPAVAGRGMQSELEHLEKALGNPTRPLAAIVGGSKVSTKLDLLLNLNQKADVLVIGGAMANTFLAAQGIDVGQSLYEPDLIPTAQEVLRTSKAKIILPQDVVVAGNLEDGQGDTISAHAIPSNQKAFDIGPVTVEAIKQSLSIAKTVIWNGPVGAFEYKPFDQATLALAKFLAQQTSNGSCLSVAGGGDTLAALAAAGVKDGLSYASSAGGAFLEWLEGKTLPGVAALEESKVSTARRA